MVRAGRKPKNFQKQNFQRIRKREKELKVHKQLEKNKPIPAVKTFRLKQFSNVSSRLQTHRSKPIESSRNIEDHEQSTEKLGESPETEKENNTLQTFNKDLDPNVSNSDSKPTPAEPKNFLKSNYKKAFDNSKFMSKKSREKRVENIRFKYINSKHHLGKLPKYLRDLREDEERVAKFEEEQSKHGAIPEGMCILDETERKNILSSMYQKLENARKERAKLPLVIETKKTKAKLAAIESEIKEHEDGIEIFSRPRVLVFKEV